MPESALPPGSITDPSSVAAEEATFTGAGGDALHGYLATPAGSGGPRPAMIVIHEAFGLNDHIRDVARRFAGAGYTVLAPDLYSREGGPDPGDIPDVMGKMLAVPDARATADLEGAAAFLRARDDASGAVGVIGFCSGGRQSLLFASTSDAATAAVDCWGGFIASAAPDQLTTPERPVPVGELAGEGRCPLFLAVGEQDDNPAPEHVEAAAARARDAGRDVTMRTYPDAGHAFFADYRPSYEPAAAAQLWRDVTAFLATHLDGTEARA
jgi:carboxymethylenebutenolidase